MPTAPLLFMLFGWAPVPPAPVPPAPSGGGGAGAYYPGFTWDYFESVKSCWWMPTGDIASANAAIRLKRDTETALEEVVGAEPSEEKAQILEYLSCQVKRDESGALVVRPERDGDPWITLTEWLLRLKIAKLPSGVVPASAVPDIVTEIATKTLVIYRSLTTRQLTGLVMLTVAIGIAVVKMMEAPEPELEMPEREASKREPPKKTRKQRKNPKKSGKKSNKSKPSRKKR